MSLRNDRVLSLTMRYAFHRLATVEHDDMLASALAFDHFAEQFKQPLRDQMTAVYLRTLNGPWVEDRRSRGRQIR